MKLSSVRLSDLALVIDSIPPKDLATAKDIRLSVRIVEKLQKACGPYMDRVIKMQIEQKEAMKKYVEEYNQKSVNMEKEEDKKGLERDLNNRFAQEVEQMHGEQLKSIQEEGKQEMECELEPEEVDKLKELFNKYAHDKFVDKKAYLEIADVLGI